jgi:hypothetical protein
LVQGRRRTRNTAADARNGNERHGQRGCRRPDDAGAHELFGPDGATALADGVFTSTVCVWSSADAEMNETCSVATVSPDSFSTVHGLTGLDLRRLLHGDVEIQLERRVVVDRRQLRLARMRSPSRTGTSPMTPAAGAVTREYCHSFFCWRICSSMALSCACVDRCSEPPA